MSLLESVQQSQMTVGFLSELLSSGETYSSSIDCCLKGSPGDTATLPIVDKGISTSLRTSWHHRNGTFKSPFKGTSLCQLFMNPVCQFT